MRFQTRYFFIGVGVPLGLKVFSKSESHMRSHPRFFDGGTRILGNLPHFLVSHISQLTTVFHKKVANFQQRPRTQVRNFFDFIIAPLIEK